MRRNQCRVHFALDSQKFSNSPFLCFNILPPAVETQSYFQVETFRSSQKNTSALGEHADNDRGFYIRETNVWKAKKKHQFIQNREKRELRRKKPHNWEKGTLCHDFCNGEAFQEIVTTRAQSPCWNSLKEQGFSSHFQMCLTNLSRESRESHQNKWWILLCLHLGGGYGSLHLPHQF